MNVIARKRSTRREWLLNSAAATLAFGVWPGCATHRGNGVGGDFSFIALNDSHYSSPECPQFFARVTESIRSLSEKPEFCLVIGDLAERGTAEELGPMRDVLRSLGMPYYPVIGNHDYLSQTDRSVWNRLYPGRLNYFFVHRDWQVVALDSSEGTRYTGTTIQPETFAWLEANLPRLDQRRPVILFTHFPLGPEMKYRPKNADTLLERFVDFNVTAVLNGHFHGFTERRIENTLFSTGKCCSIARGNHDGTKEKGYYLCRTREGTVQREFIPVKLS